MRLADGSVRLNIRLIQNSLRWKASFTQEFSRKKCLVNYRIFKDEEELREKWSNPANTWCITCKGWREGLLRWRNIATLKFTVDAEDSDVYDILRFVAYARDTMTRLANDLVLCVNIPRAVECKWAWVRWIHIKNLWNWRWKWTHVYKI